MNSEEAKSFIEEKVKGNDVLVFMKGSPDFPNCGFSAQVVQILKYFQVKFEGINILEDDALRSGVKDYSQWPTIPQLYVKGEFVGGCDITSEMAQSGELVQLFKDKEIAFKAAE